MCRLFGFRSNKPESVHPPLVAERNSLLQQSREHKDGWGIAAWEGSDRPEVAHGLGAAHADPDFERVAARTSARTVIGHVRLASVGPVILPNAHPFTHGRWAFVHNGTLRDFARHRAVVEGAIAPDLRARVRGDTDSERCFYLFLTQLRQDAPDFGRGASVSVVARALARTLRFVADVTDRTDATEGPPRSSTNFLVTDGDVMVACRRGRTLYFSEKKRRGQTPAEPPPPGVALTQLVLASEHLEGESHWHEVPEEHFVGVDGELRLHQWTLAELVGSGLVPTSESVEKAS